MRKYIALLFVLLFLGSSYAARTDQFDPHRMPYNWQGFYLGLSFGYSKANYAKQLAALGNTFRSVSDSGVSPSLQFGYNFNQYIAPEFGVVYMQKIKVRNINGTGVPVKIKNNIVYIAARISIPLWRRLFLQPKIGVGYVVRDAVIVNNVQLLRAGEFVLPVYGLGFDCRITNQWDVSLAWLQAPGRNRVQLPTSNFIGIGAAYTFY